MPANEDRNSQVQSGNITAEGRSKRYYHAPLFMVPNFDSLKSYLPYLEERNYTDLLLTPFCTPTFEKNGDKAGGSPYAFANARMNPRYTNDKQLSVDETIETVRDLVHQAEQKNIGVVFDIALNHVGHKPDISKDNPVFALLAEDIEKGVTTFDEVFCRPDEKRSPIAQDWTDVRELRMDTDEQVDNAIKYFAKPYLEFLAKCGCKKVRIDAPHMLPLKFWQKFAPVMVDLLTDEKGNPPEVILETIDPLTHYQGIYEAFPEHARRNVHHMNYQSHFKITTDDARATHPFHELYEIEMNDQHPFWEGVHDKRLTNVGVALINVTHDATDDNGQSLKSRLDLFNLNKEDFVVCRRLYNSLMQLSTPEIIRMHTDDGNDFHTQKNLFDAAPINPTEVTSEKSYSFTKELNAVHQQLHDQHKFSWYQAAHVWDNPQCMMHIARPNPGFEGKPVITFVNASDDYVKTEREQGMSGLFMETYERKCSAKPGSYIEPAEVHLLGQFSAEQIASMSARFGEVMVNGKKMINITRSKADITQTYSQTGFGTPAKVANFSPDYP